MPSDSIGIPQMLTLKEVLIGVRPVAKDFDFKMVAAPRTDKPVRAALGTNYKIFFDSLCQSYTLISDNAIILLHSVPQLDAPYLTSPILLPHLKAVSPRYAFVDVLTNPGR